MSQGSSHTEPIRSSIVLDGVQVAPLTEAGTVEHVMDELAAGRGGLLLTANVDIMFRLQQPANADLKERAALVVADGMPLVWASRIIGTPLPERVTGADLVWSLSAAAAATGSRVFLLGAAPGVADRAAEALVAANPGLQVVGTDSPPMGFEKDQAYLDALAHRLGELQVDLVFVALGFPKQERVSLELAASLPSTWFMGCGGALDMAAGHVARAHPVVQAAGAEWVHRLAQEPRRLARRYLVDDLPYAVGLVLRAGLARARRAR